ncbi:hypothetical protein GLOIN_2v1791351 [Rhizophagus irregularis DAOM 181602=DAOM 197198]|nr:hypothetical protein GLOIN_2v1791351 [Rhizophagus irregularis DAOM 181602=DAOM 197198]
MFMDKSRTPNEAALDFISKFNETYFHFITYHLSSFVQDSFLKDLFEKNPSVPKDKAKILIERFGESANPANFTSQTQATNIQPTTLLLIFSIALYAASRTWDNFSSQFFCEFSDMGNDDDDDDAESQDTDDYLMDESPLLEPDVDDLIRQGFQIPPNPVPIKLPSMPDIGKKSSKLKATQILTGYETVGEELERIRDIIVYDIPYTWDLPKIIAELKLWFNKYWTTDLGGIPVRWFSASWTL